MTSKRGKTIGKPNSRTKKYLDFIHSIKGPDGFNPDVSRETMRSLLKERFDTINSDRRANELIVQYEEDGPPNTDTTDYSLVLAKDATVAEEVERLPATPAEYDEWERQFLCSPEKKALRLLQLEHLALHGSDVARLQALKALDDRTADIDEFEGKTEQVLFRIVGEEAS